MPSAMKSQSGVVLGATEAENAKAACAYFDGDLFSKRELMDGLAADGSGYIIYEAPADFHLPDGHIGDDLNDIRRDMVESLPEAARFHSVAKQ